MTNDVLLIFLNAFNGQTKLSQSLGVEKANELNDKLELRVYNAVRNIACTKVVLHTFSDFTSGIWNSKEFISSQLSGNYLNNKIEKAFNEHIIQDKEDVNKVVFISADCPQLTKEIIEKAFESLNKCDVCIGPEKRGYYYLIGMKEPLPFLFDNKLWLGKHLLDETLEELIEHGKNYFLLPELQCVNDIYDLHLMK